MKFILFVEGKTEKGALSDFFKRWLDPRLAEPVGVRVVRFNGWSDYLDDIRSRAELNLSGKSGADVIAGIGLLDLYGPTFYPNNVSSAANRYAWAKQHIEGIVLQGRFRQYFAVHETEAWLLSDMTLLPAETRSAFPGRCAQPEQVNFDEPPSFLLDRIYRQRLHRPYKKVIDGKNLFLDLDPEAARARCPYLRRMLDEMLELAHAAVGPIVG
jgi:hypothetical protein